MSAYYNEYDKPTAAWLRDLMREGLIAKGEIDDRPIQCVTAADLRPFTQCHFFAGIGGWSRALRLAGWPDDKPVWTGSCPCQSFSTAGAKKGFDDPRHLWPEFKRLIVDPGCRPATIFGEQVANAVKLGDDKQSWLDLVSSDLGNAGYAFGAAVFPAVYVGSPHRRERLYFVGDSNRGRNHWYSPKGESLRSSVFDDFWSEADWGEGRAVKPGVRPLVDGLPGRVELLRGAGNAIVPQQAAEFIRAFIEICE